LNILANRKLRFFFAVVLALFFLLTLYSFWIEPYWIEVTHCEVKGPFARPIKIAHLTDIHASGLGRREKAMIRLVEAERPDLIVITGDSINVSSDYVGLWEVLTSLHAPLGVWLVRGNHEDWWPIADEQRYYQSAGVNLLLNSNAQVTDNLFLVGLDDEFGGRPNLDEAVAGLPESAFTIALFHSPAYFDRLAGHCSLAFAGHTHGGQVQLPIVGALWLPPFSGHYVQGWFERGGTRMFVSRGVGTSILDVRLCCRPEIAIVTITG
jgi:predicted MPP superfamily phosphohydrolase